MNRPTVALASLMALAPVALYTRSMTNRTAAAETCRALADLRIEDTNLLSATVVPAAGGQPEYCRVLGYVRPAINFEIRLPTANWNGKFYMAGCGGFCGKLGSDSDFLLDIKRALQRQYAVSMTDAGHWGENIFDTPRWAYHNRLAEIDYGHRAVHETARATKAIIEVFYRKGAAQSYFGGCSNGGRQGVMEALRYPKDFDGIISDAPGLDYTGLMLNFAWVARANTGPDGKNILMPAELKLVEKAVYRACDALDGLADGLIGDPRACRFDPSTLACAGGKSADCLSAQQVDALRALYQGPRDSAGRQLYPGLPLASEPYWGWYTGQTSDPSDDVFPRFGEGYLRYVGFEEDPGERYTVADLDFDRDPPRLAAMGKVYNATDPDLDAFRRRGGKLLMWHSWADPGPSPMKSIAYYEAVEDRVGGRDDTQAFFRLFMAPGADHCAVGEGPGIRGAGYDPLTALERWVEHKEAPASLLMTKTDSAGKVLWTRPACPYPQRAVYTGRGDRNAATSFRCAGP